MLLVTDPRAFTAKDVAGTLRSVEAFWEQLCSRVPGGTDGPAALICAAVAEQARALGLSVGASLGDVVSLARAEGATGPPAPADLPAGQEMAARLLTAFRSAGRALHAAGYGAPTSAGSVRHLAVSRGGVPKRAVSEVEIGPAGVTGDRQASRTHHGRAWQAVCLWSAETVDALQAEGHPITYGSAGENVTVDGVTWDEVRAGARLALGDEVLLECSVHALPCRKNARWFLDGDFRRMHHEQGPRWSRMYASVLRGGVVRLGDAVVLEPAAARA